MLWLTGSLLAQTGTDSLAPRTDSMLNQDTTHINQDSLSGNDHMDSSGVLISGNHLSFKNDLQLQWKILDRHPWLGFNGPLMRKEDSEIRQVTGRERLFYFLVLLFIIFAILRRAFPKYFGDLFRLFFRTTLKQRQIREQLMQTPLPSILLNGFFILSAGLYIGFLFQFFNVDPAGNFWLLYLYCCAALTAIYFIKFLVLKFLGWLFNVPVAANAYVFVVFIINKMIGILLLPFLLLLAFSEGDIYMASMSLSWCLVGGLLIYRFILAYGALRNQVKLNIFHFLLYLAAFEVVPVLLIYKALVSYFL